MKNTLDIWILLFFSFAIQSLVLALLFFIKTKGDRFANRILGVYLLLFSYNLIYNCAFWSNYIRTDPFIAIYFTNYIPWLLYGPLLFFYVRRILHHKKISIRDAIHFIPLFLILLKFGRYYVLSPSMKLEVLRQGKMSEYIMTQILPARYLLLFVVSILTLYVIIIFRLYFSYVRKEKSIALQSSWLKYISFSYAGYVLAFITYFILAYYGQITISRDYMIGGAIVFFVAMVSYFSFMQPDIFSGKISLDFKKYKNNGLSEAYSLEMKNALLKLMRSEKVYLNNDLTLELLSKEMNLSRHHTSQIINEHFHVNFFEFVNEYRINEAIDLLQESEDLNVNEILYSVGFNNRTSFYKAFKKRTGYSPKAFKQQLIQKQA